MSKTKVGIIGGTGLYELDGLENVETFDVETPFGSPSSSITRGVLGGVELFFISRHAPGHRLLPSEINYRANIYALKSLDASWCVSVSAVGSLQEEFAPGHVVIPNQLIDRTRLRENTFFGDGVVAHVAFADPYCPVLSDHLFRSSFEIASRRGSMVHQGGTFVVMEGPAFSTRAESHLYRAWGASIIGMTALPEAKLAREAEIAYATLAMVTDYDCWRSATDDVDVNDIMATMAKNAELAKEVLSVAVPKLAEQTPSTLASEALKFAVITPPEVIPEETKEKLKAILGPYLS